MPLNPGYNRRVGGGSGASVGPATTDKAGIVLLSGPARAAAGTDENSAMTPKDVHDFAGALPATHTLVRAERDGVLSMGEPDLPAVTLDQTNNRQWTSVGVIELTDAAQRDITAGDIRLQWRFNARNGATHRRITFGLRVSYLRANDSVISSDHHGSDSDSTRYTVQANGGSYSTPAAFATADIPANTAKLRFEVYPDGGAPVPGSNEPGQAFSVFFTVDSILLAAVGLVLDVQKDGTELVVKRLGLTDVRLDVAGGGSIPEGTTDPSTAPASNASRLFYNRTAHTLWFYNGSEWEEIEGQTDLQTLFDGRYVRQSGFNEFTAADEAKLDGVEAGAQANVGEEFTAAEKTKLGGVEAEATADQTGTEIVAAVDAELGNTAWKTGGSGGEAFKDIPFAHAVVFEGATQNDNFQIAAAVGSMAEREIAFGSVSDDASLGLSHASGRLSFTNTHSDADTLLETNGRIAVGHRGGAVDLQVVVREYSTTQPNTVNREVELAKHPVAADSRASGYTWFHFPLTAEVVGVRRGYTYKAFIKGTGTDGNAVYLSVRYSGGDDSERISFRRVDENLLPARDQLVALEGDARLPATAIKDLPDAARSGGNVEFGLGDNLLAASVNLASLGTSWGTAVTNWNRDPQQLVSRWASLGIRLTPGKIYQIKVGLGAATSDRTTGDNLIVRITEAPQRLDSPSGRAVNYIGFATNDDATYATSDIALHIDSIHLLEGEVTDGDVVPFPVTGEDGLPTPTAVGERRFLDRVWNGMVPGWYEAIANPNQHRNRTAMKIANNPLQAAQRIASINPTNAAGVIYDHTMIGSLAFQTGAPRFFDVALNTALTGSRRTLWLDFLSSEFSTKTTKRFRFNRGTTSGNFTLNGITYREWAVDNTETDQSGDELIQRLTELADASGDNDISVDIYTAATGDAPLNHLPQLLWQNWLGQEHMAESLHRDKLEDRLILGEKALRDFNTLKRYDSTEAAIADGVLQRPGYNFRVGAATDPILRNYHVEPGRAASGGTAGATNRRNEAKFMLYQMGNGEGYYMILVTNRGAFRKSHNVHDPLAIDPDSVMGYWSFYNGTAQTNAYVQAGIAPDWYAGPQFFTNFQGRAVPAGIDLGLDLQREGGANATSEFGGRTYNNYKAVLSDQLNRQMANGAWEFVDDEVLVQLKSSVNGSDLNFNPANDAQFTSGTGFVPPAGAVPASLGGQWESVWPNETTDDGEQRAGDIITTAAGDDRDNSRILTKDIRLARAAVICTRIQANSKANIECGYLASPINLGSASSYFAEVNNGWLQFRFQVLAVGENPSIIGTANLNSVRRIFDVLITT